MKKKKITKTNMRRKMRKYRQKHIVMCIYNQFPISNFQFPISKMETQTQTQNKKVSYLRTDNDTIINEKAIKWVQKINECLYVCTKSNGCDMIAYTNAHKISKLNCPKSYQKLNQHFEEK